MNATLDHWFALKANGTTVRTEALAGLTTFLALAYIVFVQPAVLGAAGMDFGAVMAATCLASAIGTLLMAFLANYPIAVAPAMGHNFYFAFAVVHGAAGAVAGGARRRRHCRHGVRADGRRGIAGACHRGAAAVPPARERRWASAC